MRRQRPSTVCCNLTHFRAHTVTYSRPAYSPRSGSWRVANHTRAHYVEQGDEAKPSARSTHRTEPSHRVRIP
jgi:hypothetical protein